jgi:hypothetical protein
VLLLKQFKHSSIQAKHPTAAVDALAVDALAVDALAVHYHMIAIMHIGFLRTFFKKCKHIPAHLMTS